MSSDTREGGCRCGRVRFEVTSPPMMTVACHCRNCQHMTASAFSMSEGHAPDSFRITRGDTVIGGMHGPTRHHHCDYCKSWIYTQPEGVTEFVNVRSSLFDEPISESPFVETWTSERFDWAKTGARHSYRQLPELSEWPGLLQEYAARAANIKGTKR